MRITENKKIMSEDNILLRRISKLLGEKVRWQTDREIDMYVNEYGRESETYIQDGDLYIDYVDLTPRGEDTFQDIYYILYNGEYIGYVITL